MIQIKHAFREPDQTRMRKHKKPKAQTNQTEIERKDTICEGETGAMR